MISPFSWSMLCPHWMAEESRVNSLSIVWSLVECHTLLNTERLFDVHPNPCGCHLTVQTTDLSWIIIKNIFPVLLVILQFDFDCKTLFFHWWKSNQFNWRRHVSVRVFYAQKYFLTATIWINIGAKIMKTPSRTINDTKYVSVSSSSQNDDSFAAFKWLRNSLLCGIIGTILCAFGPWLYEEIIKSQIKVSSILPVYSIWSRLPFAIITRVYLFNVTNPVDALNGSKMTVQQVGPFVFKWVPLDQLF